MPLQQNELLIRRRLGIPDEAQKVLIFAESSHWDPNWMLTSEEYYTLYVRHNLNLAIEALLEEPRRIYSIECTFFLQMYWNRSPQQHTHIRQLVNQGRLRLTNSGVTTADTLIPSTEAILRDFLLGQEWLRSHGMTQEPKLAYFADSFGATPALPSILNAAGFDRTAITRIDGMRFPGSGFREPKNALEVQSSADYLLNTEKTLDFIWRDRSDARVLCHWNAFTYGQGDMLASRGLIRLYNHPLSFRDHSEINVTGKIEKYAGQLSPLTKTPYMFCPIGFDFVKPIQNLISLLDRYNRKHYAQTGIWAVNAGLDDYLDLIDFHRDVLPIVELDSNPYWTGFYTSRPNVKRRAHDLVDRLVLAEQLALASDDDTLIQETSVELMKPWWYASVANHHDFITGTSPDRIVEGEQIPWLEDGLLHTETVIRELEADQEAGNESIEPQEAPQYTRADGNIAIETDRFHLILSERDGGTIEVLRTFNRSQSVLAELSNDILSYKDSGGLWRMGYEFQGGSWKIDERASREPVDMDFKIVRKALEIRYSNEVRGRKLERQIWLENENPLMYFRAIGKAAGGHTFTVRFGINLSVRELVMDAPGGLVIRPLQKGYDPTFWPLHQFVHLVDIERGDGIAIFQRYPGAISLKPDGILEIIAFRNAHKERAFRFLPLPGNPARGSEWEDYSFEYAVMYTPQGNWQENRLPQIAAHIDDAFIDFTHLAESNSSTPTLFDIDRDDVTVIAAKAAARGEGWILRLFTQSAMGETFRVHCKQRKIAEAYLCDARERDIESLQVRDGKVELKMPGSIATFRLIFPR
jgi:hypothetical protein